MSVRVRLSLPPHGALTLGDAHAALCNWLFARKRAGRFLLRVEDAGRAAPTGEARALDDLRWLGLSWDEEIVRQSERLDRYRAAAERLLERGAAYLCFCVPAAPASHDGGGPAGRALGCDGRCRALPRSEGERRRAAGERASVRLAVSAHALTVHDIMRGTLEFAGAEAGDFPLVAADGRPSRDLATVVDDAAMRITHVIRGGEHLASTPGQVALARALGYPCPAFAHLPVLRGPEDAPAGTLTVAAYRARGVLPESLLNALALLGWSPPPGQAEVMTLETLVRVFALDRVSGAPARLDSGRLAWLDRQHLRRAPAPRLAGLLGAPADGTTLRLLEVVRRDAGSLAEVRARLDAVVEPIPVPPSRAARPLLEAVLAALPAAIGSEEEAEALLAGVAGGARGGRRAVAQAVRAALTGESHGPAAGALLWALGAGESRRRIEQALAGVTAG